MSFKFLTPISILIDSAIVYAILPTLRFLHTPLTPGVSTVSFHSLPRTINIQVYLQVCHLHSCSSKHICLLLFMLQNNIYVVVKYIIIPQPPICNFLVCIQIEIYQCIARPLANEYNRMMNNISRQNKVIRRLKQIIAN